MAERRSRRSSVVLLLSVVCRLLVGGYYHNILHIEARRERNNRSNNNSNNSHHEVYSNSTSIYRDLRIEGYVDDTYHWKRELDEVLEEDLCKNGRNYGKCDESRFPKCNADQKICMYRQPRKDSCADGRRCKDPYFYIDYNEVRCVPLWNEREGRKFNCNKCDPGKYCPTFNRCVKRKKRFCPDWCGPGRRWCETAHKCLRYRNLDRKRRRENCPDPEWHENITLTQFKKTKRTTNTGRISAAYNLNPNPEEEEEEEEAEAESESSTANTTDVTRPAATYNALLTTGDPWS